jgi:hypothetical protein
MCDVNSDWVGRSPVGWGVECVCVKHAVIHACTWLRIVIEVSFPPPCVDGGVITLWAAVPGFTAADCVVGAHAVCQLCQMHPGTKALGLRVHFQWRVLLQNGLSRCQVLGERAGKLPYTHWADFGVLQPSPAAVRDTCTNWRNAAYAQCITQTPRPGTAQSPRR